MREEYFFGPFKFDASDRLLTRGGVVQRLGPKAADILLVLLRHHGHVVTKDELLREVWGETFVAEGSLTFQIHLIRQALEAGTAPCIETLPRRGYRFVAPVRTTAEDVRPAAPPPVVDARTSGRSIVLLAIAAVIVTLMVAQTLRGSYANSVPRVVDSVQLTHDRRLKDDSTPLLSDGRRLYYLENDTVVQRSVDIGGGDPQRLESTDFFNRVVDISPDRKSLLMVRTVSGRPGLWIAPIDAQQHPQPLGSLIVRGAAWSPDQRQLAVVVGDELLILDRQGSPLRQLGRFGRGATCPRWSPDGQMLRFQVTSLQDSSDTALWEIGNDGSNPHALFPDWAGSYQQGCGAWSRDGRYFVFDAVNRHDEWNVGSPPAQARHDLWLLRRGDDHPVQLTSGPTSFSAPLPSDDGAKIFAIGVHEEAELLRYDRTLAEFTPYLNGLSARWINFVSDGKRIIYVRHPDATLWSSNVDGTDKRQLTFRPFEADMPAVSPDERWIAFRGRPGTGHLKVASLPSAGGRPVPITGDDDVEQGGPTWAPDSRRIAFGDIPPRWEQPIGSEVIHIYDLATRRLTTVPNSNLLWTARWSPDGRFLAALTIHNQRLMIGDLSKGSWRATDDVHVDEPAWSRDGRYIYHTTEGGPKILARLRVSDGEVERFTTPAEFAATVPAWLWFGLSSNDQPILLARSGPTEIYSLKLDWR